MAATMNQAHHGASAAMSTSVSTTANSSAPSTAPRHERVLTTLPCSDRHSGELPSSTALERSGADSLTHHHLSCALASRTMPMMAHQTEQARYLGERRAWNETWNPAASRYFHVAERIPASVRRCSGTI